MLNKLRHLHGHFQLQIPRLLQDKHRVAGLSKFVLKTAQNLAALSIEEEEATLAVVQQGTDPRRDVRHKDIRLHTLMKKLKPAAYRCGYAVQTPGGAVLSQCPGL